MDLEVIMVTEDITATEAIADIEATRAQLVQPVPLAQQEQLVIPAQQVRREPQEIPV